MKKHITKMALLLALASVAISSCSLQYREHRGYNNRHYTPGYNGHRPGIYPYR